MKHTPTPWTVGMYGASADFRAIDIHAAVCKPDGALLATCGPFDEESKADAAFIVRAVNSHEALLDALKAVEENLAHVGLAGTVGILRKVCREAIAKAEEPPCPN